MSFKSKLILCSQWFNKIMDDIDILCINCENMISLEKISLHSSICLTPTKYILKLSLSDPLRLIDFRLDKLKCAMEAILHEEIKNLTTDEKMLFLYLSRQCAEVISLKDFSQESAENCEAISKSIEKYPAEFVSPCVSLYLERVIVLAVQKSEVIAEEVRIKENGMNLASVVANRASQLEGLKKQIQKFKQANGDFDTKADLLEINSNIDDKVSKASIGSSVLSPREVENANDIDDLDNMFSAQEKEISAKSNEDLQRYFYSKCLVMKLAFSSRDPAQFIQIPDLYKRVKELAIPVDMWEEFIKEQFQKPQVWVKRK